jgi:hypothetical protein
MNQVTIITHPAEIYKYKLNVINSASHGPIGMYKYVIEVDEADNAEKVNTILSLAAKPYQFTLLTEVVEYYSLEHLMEMCKLFLEMKNGAACDDFEIVKMTQPRTIHLYPTYRKLYYNEKYMTDCGQYPYISEYLYVCKLELDLLELNVITLLGLRPVSNDPLCWKANQMNRGVRWNTALVVRAEGENQQQVDEVHDTFDALESLHRKGYDKILPFQESCSTNTCTRAAV